MQTQPTKPLTAMSMLELVQILNQTQIRDFSEFGAAKGEYMARFLNYVVVPSLMEYDVEVIYALGLYAGAELRVPMECTSQYHQIDSGPYDVLPYATRDGGRHLWCSMCHQHHLHD